MLNKAYAIKGKMNTLSQLKNAIPGKEDQVSTLAAFGILMAHIAYLPAILISTMNAGEEWFGVNLQTPGYAVLILCIAVIAITGVNDWGGRMINMSRMIFLLLSAIFLPFALIFGGLGVIYTVIGGLAGLSVFWKGMALGAFHYWYISRK